jgi:hypothetical protein
MNEYEFINWLQTNFTALSEQYAEQNSAEFEYFARQEYYGGLNE